MALLLHLTDLHLSPASKGDAIGDYKEPVLTQEQYQTRTGQIRATIKALGTYLQSKRLELDGVVISGDITTASRPEGLALLPSLLGELGISLPNADRIVITPGNHDVKWNTPPSSSARYEELVELRTTMGYRTAYLDGIDIDSSGSVIGRPMAPLLEAMDGSFLLIPVNSSNNSGTLTDVEDDLVRYVAQLRQRAVTDPAINELIKAWERRGLFDIARVDNGQLVAAGALLSAFGRNARSDAPLRIAALHHPIAPVTGIEEFKPFETLTNLGQFREWLRSNEVDVVLHGHTHVSRLSHDAHTAFGARVSAESHRFIVVSGGTVGLGGPVPGPLGRLIEIAGNAPRLRPIRVAEITGSASPAILSSENVVFESVSVRSREHHAGGVVSGTTIDDVFEQLLGLGDFGNVALPLVCRIMDGPTALVLPRSYPDIRVPPADLPGWLAATVRWWQDPATGPGATFNHGERLRRYGPDALDQIRKAGVILAAKPDSSRAVAVLLRPESDLSGDDRAFPAFVFLQATIRRSKLDLMAYFRKQEMPHWWPVNMAELAEIQAELLAAVTKNHSQVQAGAITTITAMPGAGDGVPDVLIPWVDLHSGDPDQLVGIVTPLILGVPGAREKWNVAFRDWTPDVGLPLDADPVPTVGLSVLTGLLDGLKDVFPDAVQSSVVDLSRALTNIHRVNVHYKAGMNRETRPALRDEWRKDLQRELKYMDRAIDAILTRPEKF